jgi:hypothetical protein
MFANYAFIDYSAALLITFHDYLRANDYLPRRVILSDRDRSN